MTIDYMAVKKVFRNQKSRLTRAQNSGDPGKVITEVGRAYTEWNEPPFNGAWPDDWARWERAERDAINDLRYDRYYRGQERKAK